MIDKSLNYGRVHISQFLRAAAPFERVLDLGAGQGVDLELARAACPSAQLHAVECLPANLEILAAKGIKAHPLNLEVDPLPFEDESIDLVLINQVLEHVKEIFWILHQSTRVLRVGGHLIIGVPNLASLHNRLLLLTGRHPTSIKNASAHIRGYTRHDMCRTMQSIFPSGYELCQFGGSNFYPLPPLIANVFARLMPNYAVGIFFLWRKTKIYRNEFVAYPVSEQLETNFFVGGSR